MKISFEKENVQNLSVWCQSKVILTCEDTQVYLRVKKHAAVCACKILLVAFALKSLTWKLLKESKTQNKQTHIIF